MVNHPRRHAIRTASSALIVLSGCVNSPLNPNNNPTGTSLPEVNLHNETEKHIDVCFQLMQLPSKTKQANRDINIGPGNSYEISELENGKHIIQISTLGTTASHQFSIDDAHSLQVHIQNHEIEFRMLAA